MVQDEKYIYEASKTDKFGKPGLEYRLPVV